MAAAGQSATRVTPKVLTAVSETKVLRQADPKKARGTRSIDSVTVVRRIAGSIRRLTLDA